MLFNLFGNKEKNDGDQVFIDKVFIGTEGKMNACMDMAKQHPDTVFIAWFSDTAKVFKDSFSKNSLDETLIIEAYQLHPAQMQNRSIVFLEHYPLHTKETEFADKWHLSNCIVYSSLDEPLFKHFGSEKMIPIIKMMGMKENEAIEHSLVTQSIQKGQQKIAEKVLIEQTAHSQEEWMKRNMSE